MKYEEYASHARRLNPIDDDFFKKMAEDMEFCQEIIRTVLDNPEIMVTELKPQDSIKNLQGRSVILDARCIDQDGNHFTVEIQKANDDDHQKRVRYNASCVTANITDPGSRFEKIPNLCTIYISKSDFFKKGKTVYHIDRVIRETGDVVDNGFSEIYVNTRFKDGSPTSQLMTIFTVDDAYDDENFPATSRRKRYFKEDQEGAREMCEIMQEIKNEGIAEGMSKGIAEGQRSLIILQYHDGIISLTQACTYLKLSEEDFLSLEKSFGH